MPLLKALTRIGSFAAKELVEVVRRPGAFVSLIIGPFLIMALFGLGYNGYRRPLNAVVRAAAAGGPLGRTPRPTSDWPGPAVHVVAVTPDAAAADQELRDKKIDLVVIAPADVRQRLLAGPAVGHHRRVQRDRPGPCGERGDPRQPAERPGEPRDHQGRGAQGRADAGGTGGRGRIDPARRRRRADGRQARQRRPDQPHASCCSSRRRCWR